MHALFQSACSRGLEARSDVLLIAHLKWSYIFDVLHRTPCAVWHRLQSMSALAFVSSASAERGRRATLKIMSSGHSFSFFVTFAQSCSQRSQASTRSPMVPARCCPIQLGGRVSAPKGSFLSWWREGEEEKGGELRSTRAGGGEEYQEEKDEEVKDALASKLASCLPEPRKAGKTAPTESGQRLGTRRSLQVLLFQWPHDSYKRQLEQSYTNII